MLQFRFPSPGNNCKLLFTTSSLEVCRQMGAQVTMEIKSLKWEHAWQVFMKMVGEDKLRDPKFLELAQFVARTCKGIPMLLRTVGRAMASKKTFEEWEASGKGLRFQVDRDSVEGFYHLLELCFETLDQITKSCLLSFSFFPEDFTILRNELVDFWICQQLIDCGDSEEHDDVLSLGYETLDALVGACLLEEDDINSVKLLDSIRDFVSQVEITSRISNTDLFLSEKRVVVGWLFSSRMFDWTATHDYKSLLTFLLNHNPLVMFSGNDTDIASLTKLDGTFSRLLSAYRDLSDYVDLITVLDLSNSGVEEIPRDILHLVSLEYLNLSHTWIEHLPVEIKKLVWLKCLNLEYNELLRVVPKQLISGLLNLKVLKLFRCGCSAEEVKDNMLSARFMDIEPVFGLEHLEVLSISITCSSALQRLFSNNKLLSFTQSLALEVFWGVRSLDISAVATMKNLLTFEIHQVEALKELNGFSRSIEFVQERSFQKLREITLVKCSSLTKLTWVVLVPNLTIFTVKNCDEIEEIVSTKCLEEIFNGQDLEPFLKLEVLVLESIYRKALPFQQLKKVEVTDCCMLKKLPLNSTSAKADKVIIETEENWWNDVEWEDEVVKGIFVPCFKAVDDEF